MLRPLFRASAAELEALIRRHQDSAEQLRGFWPSLSIGGLDGHKIRKRGY